MNKPGPSAWIDYPTKYKLIGYIIVLDHSLNTIDRSTYSALDFLGDVGGFTKGMTYICAALLWKYKKWNLDAILLHSLFDVKNASKRHFDLPSTASLRSRIKKDFESYRATELHNNWKDLFCPDPVHKRRIQKSKELIKKQLDIKKLLQR